MLDIIFRIGGVVVFTSVMGDQMQISIGCGVNLSNKEPTKCINQMSIEQNLNPISREVLFAGTFNSLEVFLSMIEKGTDEKCILNLYHTYWLHEKQSVQVKSDNGVVKEGTIMSLDGDGFLLVELENNLVSVYPDGNSFDMLQGLIFPKN